MAGTHVCVFRVFGAGAVEVTRKVLRVAVADAGFPVWFVSEDESASSMPGLWRLLERVGVRGGLGGAVEVGVVS